MKFSIMKNIKQIIVVVAFLLGGAAMSQEESVELFTVPLSNPSSPGKLILSQITGSINVIGYEGAEVIVKASMSEQKSKKKTTNNGMKRIGNTSLAVSGEERNNTVRIINEQHNRRTDWEIKVPVNFSLKLSTVNRGNISVEGVKGEMEITNTNGHITLTNVDGSASVDTTNGDVKVTFNTVSAGANMAFSSFNGDIDITFPKALKADVKAKSDQGEIFTDFDIAVDPQKAVVNTNKSSDTYRVKIEQWVKGKINGGGPEMLFKTWNGDILIRAK